MNLSMTWYVIAIVGVLGYFGITVIMQVVAAHFHRERSVHELVRQAKQAKIDYYHELAIRQGLIPDDRPGGGIDVLDDDGDVISEDDPAPIGKIEPADTADTAKQAA